MPSFDEETQKNAQADNNGKSTHKPHSRMWRFIKICFFLGLGFGLAGLLTLIGLYAYLAQDLPDFRDIEDYKPPQTTRIYAADGSILGEIFEERRTMVPLEEIALSLQNAVLAAEDADFYHHEGLDYAGMLRALKDALKKGHFTSGASTITQQTVKNLLLTPEKTITRKLREHILARRLDSHLTKQDILTIYLNMIYLGHGRYGVEEGARYYFGKHASDLELAEAALLAGLIQSPERLSPRKHPEEALRRRSYVLNQMKTHHFATANEVDEAQKKPLELTPPPSIETPEIGWFVEMVRAEVEKRYGRELVRRGGLKIYTALDPKRQAAAVAALQHGLQQLDQRHNYGHPNKNVGEDGLEKWREQRKKQLKDQPPTLGQTLVGRYEGQQESQLLFDLGIGKAKVSPSSLERFSHGKKPLELKEGDLMTLTIREDGPRYPEIMQAVVASVPQGALIALDPKTRQILAFVGGYNFSDAPFNRALSARRQPGSLFKTMVWGAAFETRRFTPATTLIDSPETWHMYQGQWWTPQNYTKRFQGPLTLRKALANSVNSISIKLASDIGVENVQSFARRAGIRSKLTDSLTLSLGSSEVTPLEIVNAYATLAADGIYQPPKFISKIEGLDPNELEDLPEEEPPELTEALAPDLVWLLRAVMRSVVTEGSAKKLSKLSRPIVGKTGTSNDARDAWFVGLLPDVALVIWLGFDQPRSLGKKESGGGAAVPIAFEYFQQVDKEGDVWPEMPETIIQLQIDPETGRRTKEGGIAEYFLSGTEPSEFVLTQGETDAENFLKEETKDEPSSEDTDEMFIPHIDVADLPESLKPVAPVYMAPVEEKNVEDQIVTNEEYDFMADQLDPSDDSPSAAPSAPRWPENAMQNASPSHKTSQDAEERTALQPKEIQDEIDNSERDEDDPDEDAP